MDNDKQAIMEQIFDLRNEQANVTPDERAEIQAEIIELQKQLDA